MSLNRARLCACSRRTTVPLFCPTPTRRCHRYEVIARRGLRVTFCVVRCVRTSRIDRHMLSQSVTDSLFGICSRLDKALSIATRAAGRAARTPAMTSSLPAPHRGHSQRRWSRNRALAHAAAEIDCSASKRRRVHSARVPASVSHASIVEKTISRTTGSPVQSECGEPAEPHRAQ